MNKKILLLTAAGGFGVCCISGSPSAVGTIAAAIASVATKTPSIISLEQPLPPKKETPLLPPLRVTRLPRLNKNRNRAERRASRFGKNN